MNETVTTCPICRGAGASVMLACGPSGSSIQQRTCEACQGAKFVDADRAARYQAIKATRAEVRRARIDRGEYLHDAAEKRGIGVAEYSRWEVGRDIWGSLEP